MRAVSIIIALFFSCTLISQTYWSDSLKTAVKSASGLDKARLTGELALEMQEVDMDSAIWYANSSIEQYQKLDNLTGEAHSTTILATIIQMTSDYLEVVRIRKTLLPKMQELGDDSAYASCYCYIGEAYAFANEFDSAMKYTLKCTELGEKYGIAAVLGDAYDNMGTIYDYQGRTKDALSAYKKALSFFDHDEYNEILTIINNVATVYDNLPDSLYIDSSQKYFEWALDISQKIDYRFAQSVILGSLSGVYNRRGNYTKALELADSSYALGLQINSDARIASCYGAYGNIYSLMGDKQRADQYYQKSLIAYNKLGDINNLQTLYLMMSENYYEWGKYKQAYDNLFTYKTISDSLLNEQIIASEADMKGKYEFEKQQRLIEKAQTREEIARLDADKQQAESDRKTGYLFGAGLAGILLIIVVLLAIRTNIKTKKANEVISYQKKEVELQKDIVDEKNKEILDSISYAKRIQTAILPPDKLIKQHLPDSFVLYKPKDIVAGDFYWMEAIEGKVFFAAADCTGHGVPGAMVSVICNGSLNRSVREFGLLNPGEILDKTRELVIQEFEKSEEEVKDGMDIALCSLEAVENGAILEFSGANNPLWIIRKDTNVIEEIKANKQPIGKFDNPLPYATTKLNLNSGDQIYLFSDGFADQFGGEKGKKLKAANFKKILVANKSESMDQQLALLDESFENWKGDLEQLDDVCVIGVRI